MDCRNCGQKLSAEAGTIDRSDPNTTRYVCSECWMWTEDVFMKE